jgi:hypothetical protein
MGVYINCHIELVEMLIFYSLKLGDFAQRGMFIYLWARIANPRNRFKFLGITCSNQLP